MVVCKRASRVTAVQLYVCVCRVNVRVWIPYMVCTMHYAYESEWMSR